MRYKRAALKDHLGKITGTSAGALAGGLGGYGLAGLFSDNKSIKILAALAGAVGGGYGGYRLGNYMDTQRAGLIGENKDLTNKYNASQDELQATKQQVQQAKGQLERANYVNQDLAGDLSYMKQLRKEDQKVYSRMIKQHDDAAKREATLRINNEAAAKKIQQQQDYIRQLKAVLAQMQGN